MNEHAWMNATDPTPMLKFLRSSGKLSERKARLFAFAVSRRIWHLMRDRRCREAIEVAERVVEGFASREEWDAAREVASEAWSDEEAEYATRIFHEGALPTPPDWEVALAVDRAFASDPLDAATECCERSVAAIAAASGDSAGELRRQVEVIQDLFGPTSFRPVTLPQSVRTWSHGCIVKLATAAYEERAMPEGTLDPQRLAVLADALEEAGCQDQDILGHLRQPGGVHVRGCWPLDLLLGKE